MLYLEAKEELTYGVAEANALFSTGAPAQLIYDDQRPVADVVDYIRDLQMRNISDNLVLFFPPHDVNDDNSTKHTSFISSIKVEELVSKSSSTPILVKIWSAMRNEAYVAGTYEP